MQSVANIDYYEIIFDHFLTYIGRYLSQPHLRTKEHAKQWLFLDVMASLQLLEDSSLSVKCFSSLKKIFHFHQCQTFNWKEKILVLQFSKCLALYIFFSYFIFISDQGIGTRANTLSTRLRRLQQKLLSVIVCIFGKIYLPG